MGRRFLPLVFLLLYSSIALLAATSSWVEVRSQHFRVLTNASEQQGKEVGRRFEQMRGVFGVMFHKARLNSPVPLDIVAFKTQDEFMRYVPQWKGKPVSLSGFFQAADDRNFIGIEMSSSDPYGSVSHEYAHLLLRNNFPVMPLWFEEGFAEYFSTLKVTGQQAEVGAMQPQYVALLSSGQWMPITALFSVQHDSDVYNENERRSIFYAESWLAVHYLLSNDRLVDAFKYLQMAQLQRVPVPDAIQQAFGVDAATFEKNLRAYLTAQHNPTRMPVPELNDEPYRTAKLTDADARAILADMHAHSNDYSHQALEEFQAVLRQDPMNAIANRGIGYWYLRNDHFDEAAEAFKKALTVDDNNAQLHYLVAYLMNRKALKEGRPPDQPEAMRAQLERAIQIDNTIADAHNLLAFALAAQRKYDMAINAEKKAIELNPSAEIYQANLSHLYIQAERWDDADALLQRLQTSSDAKVRDNATENLAALKSNRESAAEQRRMKSMGVSDPTAPQWKVPDDMKNAAPSEAESEAKPDTRKTMYLSGQLETVDCSRDPAAVLTVRKGPKVMKLRTENYRKLIVMGADEFSCGWRGKKVLINYKPGGKSDGDLVSLELQAGQ